MRSRTRQFDGVFSRGSSGSRAAIALVGIWAALAPVPAAAFELFGVRLWGKDDAEEAAIVDPLRYTLTFNAGTQDPELRAALESASSLLSDQERPVSGSLGLLAKARNEREQLVAALYENGRYNGVVELRIAGTLLDDIPLDARFGAGPVPVDVVVTPGNAFAFGNIVV